MYSRAYIESRRFTVAFGRLYGKALVVCAVVLMVISGSLSAQTIPFTLELNFDDSQVEAESISFVDMEDGISAAGPDGGISAACISITARENIPVKVSFMQEDVSPPVPSRLRQLRPSVEVEPRFMNDGGPCPALPEAGLQASQPFSGSDASFYLHETGLLIDRFPGEQRRLTARLYLLGRYTPGQQPASVLDTRPQPYKGRLTIQIEYL